MRKALLICGILSSLHYIAINIFVPLQFEGYSIVSQTVSELSAVDAPTRTLWVLLSIPYTLFVILFGIGVLQASGHNRPLRIAGNLILANGIISIGWPFAPMHLREVIAAGGGTFSDTMHIALSFVTVFLMLLTMGFGAAAFGKSFKFYSIATMISLAIFGVLTSLEAPGIEANLPTPMIGVWERINIGVYMLWVIVFAIVLLRPVKMPRD